MTQPVVFISYSRRDEAEKEKLVSHLGVLQGAGLVDLWSDDRIGAGEAWQVNIKQAITRSKIAVLLITANFLNSEFILRTEVPALLKRREREGLVVFPVIARACAWRTVDWLRQMDVRPKNGIPVWNNEGTHVDEDLSLIAEDILKVIEPRVKGMACTLTVDRPKPLLSIDEVSQPRPKPAKPRRILVVDDEPTWQRRLSRILRELDCAVVTAGSYEQAEDMLVEFDFDLVTIDLNLDKATQYADGLELVLRLRETFGQRMPIIIITGTGNLEEQRRAFKDYGVIDFIQKAKLDLDEFQNAVIKATDASQTLSQSRPHRHPLAVL
jgi:CheY-like chemotaxis protein